VHDTLVAPAFHSVPAHAVASNGPAAADLASLAGIDLDAEQRLMLDAILAVDDEGRWAAIDSAIVCPRQNGKTVVLQVVALADLFLFDARLVTWTAHLFPTAQEAFRDLEAIISGTPEFARRVRSVSRANGEEGFELTGDRRLQFAARSKTRGRGLTGDRVILDEAFAIGPAELGSLYPTLSARPNPSVVYASSAGMIGSHVLRGLRDRGRHGGDDSLVWVEWAAPATDCADMRCDHRPGKEGCALDDHELWRRANFTMGRRITVRYLESERRTLPPEEFMRERLGWWSEPAAGVSGIPEDRWRACANRDAELPDPVVLGLDVAPGHVAAAITAHSGGVTHVADHHAGTAWILGDATTPGRLLEIVAEHDVLAVVIDPTGPVGGMIPDLERAGLSVRSTRNPTGLLVLLDGREQTQACEQFLAGVLDGTFVHRDQHVLNAAVKGAGRRQVGDSWKWSRRDSTVDISPLVAATAGSFVSSKPEAPHVDVHLIDLGAL
jgi:hypothetical protein